MAFAVALIASGLAACNVHELGHVLVSVPLGWEVETVSWCTPGAGSVEYSRVGVWAGNLQGFAGGVLAALFLAGAQWVILGRRERPRRSPELWALGLGMVVWIGPQLVIAVMEGMAGPNEDYTDLFRASPWTYVPLVILAGLVGPVIWARRWPVRSSPSAGDS